MVSRRQFLELAGVAAGTAALRFPWGRRALPQTPQAIPFLHLWLACNRAKQKRLPSLVKNAQRGKSKLAS
jgi:hypothetical protein